MNHDKNFIAKKYKNMVVVEVQNRNNALREILKLYVENNQCNQDVSFDELHRKTSENKKDKNFYEG